MIEVVDFSAIETEFMQRAQYAVYCNVATVDLNGRPRSRVMHAVWDGPLGYVITWPQSHKAKHLANNPHVSLAYIGNPLKPLYAECVASWVTDPQEQWRIWNLHKTIPPPLGFDPTPHYGSIEGQYFGLLQFTPWRIELAELGKDSLLWRLS